MDSVKTFAKLPDEMKAKVFSYLEKESLYRSIALVCEDWRRVATEWLGIRDKAIFYRQKFTLEESVRVVTSNRTHLKSVTLLDWTGEDSDSLLKVVAENLPHLRRLSIRDSLVSQNVLELIARECSQLQRIHLGALHWGDYSRHPLDILNSCRELEEIAISGDVVPPPLDVAIINWPKLTSMSLAMENAEREVEVLARTLGGQLRKLCIDGFRKPESYLLLGCFPQLEELEIIYCAALTDTALQDGVGQLRNLRSLNLVYAQVCTAPGLQGFFSKPNIVGRLEKLRFSNCPTVDDNCISAIAMNCPLLTDFCLVRNNHVTNAPFRDLVRRCHNLQHLELFMCSKLDLSTEALRQIPVAGGTLRITIMK